jgi:hypothetical protein
VDTAFEFSMKFGIPFLPQIPIRNPWEYMVPQALEGLAGIELQTDGVVVLHPEVWESQSHLLSRRLEQAFADENFESFEPSSPTSSCWEPFLWELQERGHRVAKAQIAGPMTTQMALKIKSQISTPIYLKSYPELSGQIFKLVLARALAMVTRMVKVGIQPLFYLDEPGLFALSRKQGQHLLYLQELKLMICTLQKAGALVGLHCCSNTDWEAIFHLDLDLLSIDTALSLDLALGLHSVPTHSVPQTERAALETWLRGGGRFSFGIVPTNQNAQSSEVPPTASALARFLKERFEKTFPNDPQLRDQILKQAIFTPACGLALQDTTEVERTYEHLMKVYEHFDFT